MATRLTGQNASEFVPASKIVRKPMQKRSQETLNQIIIAAGKLLSNSGGSGFTMSDVAAEAGVSTGLLYANFPSKAALISGIKEMILDDFDFRIAAAVGGERPPQSLKEVVHSYAFALSGVFEENGAIFGRLLSPDQGEEIKARSRRTWAFARTAFLEAALRFIHEIDHPEPVRAVRFVSQSITGALIHASQLKDDDFTWTELATELAEMALSYLHSAAEPVS